MNKKQKEVQQVFLDNEKAVLRELTHAYNDSLAQINQKIELLMARQDADMQHVIYQIKHQKALKTQVQSILEQLQAKEFDTVSEFLATSYTDGFVGTMYDMHGQGVPIIVPIDQKQVVDAIKHDTKLSENLYTSLGKDIKKLNKQIAGEISRGIASGQGYMEIARNIENYANIPKNRAMTIARTESHRIQCKSTLDAQHKAKEKGADVLKMWDAALDGDTRKNHRKLDGQLRELDEPFEVDGHKAMHPSGFGRPEEDINCRCALLQRARWALDEAELDKLKERAAYFELDKSDDFADFKKKYLKAAEEESVLDNVQKKNIDNVPAKEAVDKKESVSTKTVEDISKESTESLLNAYDERRKHFNMNMSSADDLRNMGKLNPVTVNYDGVSVETAKAFGDTIQALSDEYYTGFTKIKVGDMKEFFSVPIFATTEHNNLVGQKTLILNPYKTKNYNKFTERIKELSDRGYAVKIKEGLEGEYIATHEFAHSLIDLSGDYKNYVGMDVKQMKGIKKEIDSIFDNYKQEVSVLESAYKEKELAFLNASMSLDVDMDELSKMQKEALEAKQALDAVKISKYSLENADEFMAEAFTQSKIGVSQSKYSDDVMNVLDKHFKKEPLENIGKSGKIELDLQLFAKIPDEKFTGYALNPSKDPDKAKAFQQALGYNMDNYELLKENILNNLDESKFVEKGDSGYGMKYEQILELTGVNGKKANVLTAWIQDGDDKRLVSVYVDDRKGGK